MSVMPSYSFPFFHVKLYSALDTTFAFFLALSMYYHNSPVRIFVVDCLLLIRGSAMVYLLRWTILVWGKWGPGGQSRIGKNLTLLFSNTTKCPKRLIHSSHQGILQMPSNLLHTFAVTSDMLIALAVTTTLLHNGTLLPTFIATSRDCCCHACIGPYPTRFINSARTQRAWGGRMRNEVTRTRTCARAWGCLRTRGILGYICAGAGIGDGSKAEGKRVVDGEGTGGEGVIGGYAGWNGGFGRVE